MSRPYEVMIIFNPDLDEAAVQAATERVTDLVRSRAGMPGQVHVWGRRRLAYEIDHRSEGSYILVEATAEPAVMADLDRSLRLADDVLRHKVIRLPERKAGRGGRQSSIAARPAAAQQQNVNGA